MEDTEANNDNPVADARDARDARDATDAADAIVETKVIKVGDENCVHSWIIDSPEGAISVGACRKCGREEEFKNSVEYSVWTSRTRTGRRKGMRRRDDDELEE